jgi:hypothetical protein
VVERLPSKCEALNENSSNAKRKKETDRHCTVEQEAPGKAWERRPRSLGSGWRLGRHRAQPKVAHGTSKGDDPKVGTPGLGIG